MAALARFPDVAQVAAATPADRDRVVDVIRITSLIGVVLGHTVMAISIIRDHVLIWDNLLTASVVFQAATWMLQIMPLFFFAGAAACLSSWSAGTNWGDWLMKRCTRLFRPVFYYLAFWAVALTVLYRVLRQHIYEPVAGVSTQLLWFLGAYVLVLAAMPVLYRITTAGRLAAGVAGVYGAIAAIDAIRLHWPAMMPWATSTWSSGSSPPCSASPTAGGCSPGAPHWSSRPSGSPSTSRWCTGVRTRSAWSAPVITTCPTPAHPRCCWPGTQSS